MLKKLTIILVLTLTVFTLYYTYTIYILYYLYLFINNIIVYSIVYIVK